VNFFEGWDVPAATNRSISVAIPIATRIEDFFFSTRMTCGFSSAGMSGRDSAGAGVAAAERRQRRHQVQRHDGNVVSHVSGQPLDR